MEDDGKGADTGRTPQPLPRILQPGTSATKTLPASTIQTAGLEAALVSRGARTPACQTAGLAQLT